MVLRRFLKTIQSEENSFQVPMEFPDGRMIESGRKNARFHTSGAASRAISA